MIKPMLQRLAGGVAVAVVCLTAASAQDQPPAATPDVQPPVTTDVQPPTGTQVQPGRDMAIPAPAQPPAAMPETPPPAATPPANPDVPQAGTQVQPTPDATPPAPEQPPPPSAAPARPAASAQPENPALQQVASFPHQVTGVTVATDGRIFVNFPRWTEDVPVSVAEVMPDGSIRPYPDEQWNAWRNARMNEMSLGDHFVCVQSVVADDRGNLWVLDPAAPGNEKALPGGPKLVKIDLKTDQVAKVIPFPGDVALQGSYLNDIRFSPDGKVAFITDSGLRGAIIVVNLASGHSWRLLDGHPSTQPEKNVTVQIDGQPLRRPDGRAPVFAADGIALSKDGKSLYWQALTGNTLYRIDTAALRTRISPRQVAARVEVVGQTTVADGLLMGADGKLYVTSPQDDAVKVWTGSGLETAIQDPRLRWPDTLAQGPDGAIYVTASHIQDSAWFKPDAPVALTTELFRFAPDQASPAGPARPTEP
jgi:sugar lactone lactonase YvrE